MIINVTVPVDVRRADGARWIDLDRAERERLARAAGQGVTEALSRFVDAGRFEVEGASASVDWEGITADPAE